MHQHKRSNTTWSLIILASLQCMTKNKDIIQINQADLPLQTCQHSCYNFLEWGWCINHDPLVNALMSTKRSFRNKWMHSNLMKPRLQIQHEIHHYTEKDKHSSHNHFELLLVDTKMESTISFLD